jgi:hypothetical protein
VAKLVEHGNVRYVAAKDALQLACSFMTFVISGAHGKFDTDPFLGEATIKGGERKTEGQFNFLQMLFTPVSVCVLFSAPTS